MTQQTAASNTPAEESTAGRVAAVILDLFGVPPAALSEDVVLQEGLQLDSLSVVELQVAIEDALDLRFDDTTAAGVETFGELVSAVDAMLRGDSSEDVDRKAS